VRNDANRALQLRQKQQLRRATHSNRALNPPSLLFSQAALLTLAVRWVRAWFARLDADAAILSAAVTLEDPASAVRVPAPSLWAEPSKALSVIIPAYNEEARLPRALDEAFR